MSIQDIIFSQFSSCLVICFGLEGGIWFCFIGSVREYWALVLALCSSCFRLVSFEGRGRKDVGRERKEGEGERRESLSLIWELKKPTREGDG